MSGVEERLAALEAEVGRLADERAVTRLVLSYGPLVDSGSADEVAGLWEPDGVYDVDELFMAGREQIAAMVRSTGHQDWIRGGCAHFAGPPHVTVHEDEATAVGYTAMVVRDGERFVLRRATANVWRLRRGPDGWRVVTRTNRLLDGRAESRALFADALGAAES
ncbi:nuclear transport factor 2 family protein [Saccharopolyspora sp. HNM0983]|uniref:Nuclear transport factor 2 family protein n=1 Tax=Saccharopolyspora montiporae TaxID=2781240 RepID=A0A929B7P2_9PSEU|nr:nuclear transport factor 2 family protein [Saccharopolyspora sp. HNM0983]MBE9372941.1 nuclear transport factor 2 family protein [Saccharopolyspora sp. HNM0983]